MRNNEWENIMKKQEKRIVKRRNGETSTGEKNYREKEQEDGRKIGRKKRRKKEE